MRFGIVISDAKDWMTRSLVSAFQRRGAEVKFLDFSELAVSIDGQLSFSSNGIDLLELEGLVVRDLGRRGAHDVAFRFEILRTLASMGMRVINPPEAIATAANKSATTLALQRSGVPTPRTTITTDPDKAIQVLYEYGKAVSKPLFGYKGKDVQLLAIGDEDKLLKILERNGIVYLQDFVESKHPRDIRAFVVGDQALGAIYRVAPPGAWISNLAQGGLAEQCLMTEELKDLAVRASCAIGATYSGVDLLESSEGLKVIEVNGTPSGKGIYQALRIDVTEVIVDNVLRF
jgi:tetrahydromethanopterin:alpha-L-glutamate ligase